MRHSPTGLAICAAGFLSACTSEPFRVMSTYESQTESRFLFDGQEYSIYDRPDLKKMTLQTDIDSSKILVASTYYPLAGRSLETWRGAGEAWLKSQGRKCEILDLSSLFAGAPVWEVTYTCDGTELPMKPSLK